VPPIPRGLLGVAWGALAAVPLVARAHRVALAERLGSPARAVPARPHHQLLARARSFTKRVLGATGPVGRVIGAFTRRQRARHVDAALERELPVALDLLGVAVGAGCTPYLAVEVASRWASPVVAASFASVLGACALGASFDAALDDAARSAPRLRALFDALLASDRLGAPVGPALARLAAEERAMLRRRAETHARRVPVRLLFPLVFLVLPAFVLLTVVPGLAAGLSRL
jgi:Type II secretion system (T2SS), protein F